MPEFVVAIVDRPEIKTVGLKVRTTMAKASQDCPNLWRVDFGPRMDSIPFNPEYAGQSFGVSVMLDEDTFDYWAVAPIADGADVPDGMDLLTLPGGKYAECKVASLDELGAAFSYIYMQWIRGQEKYTMNMQGCSYELYTMDFMKSGALTIYCPLLEK